MKKLFFAAALGVAGFMSAKDLVSTHSSNINSEITGTKEITISGENTTYKVAFFYNWITVTSSCGKVYYLEASHYNSFEQLQADVDYFDGQKCG